ncbi:MAG: tRNA pseudouridine(38-40) synthase TruA [Polyangiaceae bacterium]|nr:tRNA pseudouridine(38-40) synthase TruA [Polyangiaceae bacterium]
MSEGVLLTVAYAGGGFSGWAPQRGQRTAHDALLDAVRTMRAGVSGLRAASRTDAGVHARDQRVAFDSDGVITPRGWALGLNARLPDDVSVRGACRVEAGFDPRFASRGKRYAYRVLCDPLRDPFLEQTHLRVTRPLDLVAMRAEAADAVGQHDFAAFRSVADHRTNTVRTLSRVDVVRHPTDARRVAIVVEGDGFLHNMVRILAGTLVQIGQGRRARGAFARGLASRARDDLGKTAPAHGLTLEQVLVDARGADVFP